MDFIGIGAGKDVVGDWKFPVAGVEVDDVVGSPSRNIVQDFFGEVTVGIDQSASLPIFDVAYKKIFEQGGFARAGLANEVDMLAAVGVSKKKRLCAAPNIALSHD